MEQIGIRTIMNMANSYLKEKCNVVAFDDTQKAQKVISELVDICNVDQFEGFMKEKGISLEIMRKLEEELPEAVKCIQFVVEYSNNMFGAIDDSISDVKSQMHSDKLQKAMDDKKRFVKRFRGGEIDEIKQLRWSVEEHRSDLVSDIREKVRECHKEIKMIGGFLTAKKIRQALEQLKESLPAYVDLTILLSKMEVYLGKIEDAKDTLEEAEKVIEGYFPFRDSDIGEQKNRMYKLTDEAYWIEKPKEYFFMMQEQKEQLKQLRSTELITMKGR